MGGVRPHEEAPASLAQRIARRFLWLAVAVLFYVLSFGPVVGVASRLNEPFCYIALLFLPLWVVTEQAGGDIVPASYLEMWGYDDGTCGGMGGGG